MSAWWLQYYTTLFQYTILYTHIHTYIDIIILHYYITLLQVYYITPLRHILYALSILPHNEYSLRTIFIHYSIIWLYTSTVQRYTPYHNICFNALFHFLHFSSLPIYLFISNTHSSIPRCNNLSFINYTFIYARKNSETKNQSAFGTFHWSQKIIWIEICWQVMGARSPSKSGILSRVSSRGEEPDEYPDKQPVAWPARSISVQAQHPQPFFPSSQSASRFIPLWGNSSSFFFLLLFLPLSSNEASGFQGEDTLPVLGELILETRRRKERDLKRRRKSKLWDCLLHWMGERMVF